MHGEKYFDFVDRKAIAKAWKEGRSARSIADMLGVHESTIYRELKRGRHGEECLDKNYRPVYDPTLAQKCFQANLRSRVKNAGRPKKKP